MATPHTDASPGRAPRLPPSLPPLAFEGRPGDASCPLPRRYRRREPERTALHSVVRGHLRAFVEDGRLRFDSGAGFPAFVEHEFRRYLDCGLLQHGFARLRCPSCGFEQLVAFSCKGRLCPSCWARRAAATAADLEDRVLPEARYRQWVLTFPWQMRFHLATDRAFQSAVLRAFLLTLAAWLRRRGRAQGIRDGQAGAVTFVQRLQVPGERRPDRGHGHEPGRGSRRRHFGADRSPAGNPVGGHAFPLPGGDAFVGSGSGP